MSNYIDGFLIPITKDKLDEYKKMSQRIAEIYKEHGALEYCECVGDDLNVEGLVSFNKAAGASENEMVMFAWIVFESKEHREKVNAAVQSDRRIIEECKTDSFLDFNKLVYGGFKSLVKF